MSSEPMVVLPPHWFALDAFDALPLNARMEKLVKMRELINDEIVYLRSLLSKPGTSVHLPAFDAA